MQDWGGMTPQSDPQTSAATHDPEHDARLAAWTAFLRAHARVTRELEHELEAEQDLSLADFDLLYQLAVTDDGRLRMSELADRLALSRSGATRLVDRLESAGLVDRQTCATDRRGYWAAITDAGVGRLRDATPTHLRGVCEYFIDRIPPAELEQLRRTLERIVVSPENDLVSD
jgi:DNA-binding MarR family transcriptional regulator